MGIEYKRENDFWVLKYQFQFWYQKSQKNFGIRYHETGENISPNPSKFPKYRLASMPRFGNRKIEDIETWREVCQYLSRDHGVHSCDLL